MNIIKRKSLMRYIELFPDAETSLLSWFTINKETIFKHFSDLKKVYPHADYIKGTDLVCIYIKGNKYRLIVRYTWGKTVFIKDFLPHAANSEKYC
ncbi:MAG: type II toxin-antitoxin system HigB family toxin [Spirochaetales bacterium]|nr:type II toxin-antitoxin system HigB family toxin [Spirochaetales bacterium]